MTRDVAEEMMDISQSGTIELHLTLAERKKLIEHGVGEPCFRVWLTIEEYAATCEKDWSVHKLKDGRWAAWRKESDVTSLQDKELAAFISSRRLPDDVE